MRSEMFPGQEHCTDRETDARPSAQIPYPETQDWSSASSFHMVIPWGCSPHTACYKSPVKKQGTQERCLAHGQRDRRPDFHVSQYHILPGCLICSDAEFPLETVSSREVSQLCRSANHSCFSIQMFETASSKLFPGAELPVGDCTDISSALYPYHQTWKLLSATPCSSVPPHRAGYYFKPGQVGFSLTVQRCGWKRTGSLRSFVSFRLM